MFAYRETPNPDELYHHGILGMKWGIRRFQRKDGSLTDAGKKRQRISESDTKTPEPSKPKPKKIGELSDSELKDKINRLNMEKQAYGLERDIASLNPKKVSAGQKFVKGLADTVGPAVKNAGQNLLTEWFKKQGKDLLGIKDDDIDSLKKEVERLRLTKDKKDLTTEDPFKELKDKVAEAKLKKEYDDYVNPKKDPYEEMRKAVKDAATKEAYEKLKKKIAEQDAADAEEKRKREEAGRIFIAGLLEAPKD